ncbi:uncharacterized protein MONOS_306 [Monocercomonoides exilis]|uniref:uncharacterized protein n=1 Tax=Monocercomonoides exilis TaxID=2049356 RepID=UPI0035599D8D|nr:hypothetical protein MONOS_306 [Monocercomonoides exilis]|eukprot:MONOS_306.1-p1 / transcript=MONOS_306.1 / gene=MONOS_306 / organism=Monocercomonoides_exilis_PA203 / gene_product=unspecified product / transcript_product=unspecified product / location=Mono_scaffold00005:93199-95213(-) / protein_length=450 / sequence_SO=supercontig / SO=protein_coding / is_pseudo=false
MSCGSVLLGMSVGFVGDMFFFWIFALLGLLLLLTAMLSFATACCCGGKKRHTVIAHFSQFLTLFLTFVTPIVAIASFLSPVIFYLVIGTEEGLESIVKYSDAECLMITMDCASYIVDHFYTKILFVPLTTVISFFLLIILFYSSSIIFNRFDFSKFSLLFTTIVMFCVGMVVLIFASILLEQLGRLHFMSFALVAIVLGGCVILCSIIGMVASLLQKCQFPMLTFHVIFTVTSALGILSFVIICFVTTGEQVKSIDGDAETLSIFLNRFEMIQAFPPDDQNAYMKTVISQMMKMVSAVGAIVCFYEFLSLFPSLSLIFKREDRFVHSTASESSVFYSASSSATAYTSDTDSSSDYGSSNALGRNVRMNGNAAVSSPAHSSAAHSNLLSVMEEAIVSNASDMLFCSEASQQDSMNRAFLTTSERIETLANAYECGTATPESNRIQSVYSL